VAGFVRADPYYQTLILHNNAGPLGTAASLHAALAIPNVTQLEAPWANREAETDVCWPYPEIVDGYALPLEGPGLGIEANVPLDDEELAASKPFVPSLQVPRLRGQVECTGWVSTGFLNASMCNDVDGLTCSVRKSIISI
jgi:hypothetical protein